MSITCPKCGNGKMIFYDMEDEDFADPKYYCDYCNYTTKNPDSPYRNKKKQGGKSKMANPWIEHVKKVKKEYPKLPLKDVLKIAKRSYKK